MRRAAGLCGTILHVRPKGNADDKGYRVWVCVANAVSPCQMPHNSALHVALDGLARHTVTLLYQCLANTLWWSAGLDIPKALGPLQCCDRPC